MLPLLSSVPVLGLPGNHELQPFDLPFTPFRHRFLSPAVGASMTELKDPSRSELNRVIETSPLYYATNLGAAHVIMLNSEEPIHAESPQHRWLVGDLSR